MKKLILIFLICLRIVFGAQDKDRSNVDANIVELEEKITQLKFENEELRSKIVELEKVSNSVKDFKETSSIYYNVDQFYKSSWEKLLWILALLGGTGALLFGRYTNTVRESIKENKEEINFFLDRRIKDYEELIKTYRKMTIDGVEDSLSKIYEKEDKRIEEKFNIQESLLEESLNEKSIELKKNLEEQIENDKKDLKLEIEKLLKEKFEAVEKKVQNEEQRLENLLKEKSDELKNELQKQSDKNKGELLNEFDIFNFVSNTKLKMSLYKNKANVSEKISDYEAILKEVQNKDLNSENKNELLSSLYFYVAYFAYEAKDLRKTIENYKKVIEIDPKYSAAYNNIANAYKTRGAEGDLEKAIENYKKAIEIDPKYITAYYNVAIAYKARGAEGDLEKAIENYKKAIEINPKYITAYNNIANAYKVRGAEGDLEKAIENYKKAIEIDPEYITAYNNMANAYKARGAEGDLEKAIENYKKIIEIDPNNKRAKENLKKILND